MSFRTLAEIKRANRAAGGHWFGRGNVAEFESRFGRQVFGGRFFIELWRPNPRRPRVYSVREVRADGSIRNAAPSDRSGYATYDEAKAAAIALVEAGEGQ